MKITNFSFMGIVSFLGIIVGMFSESVAAETTGSVNGFFLCLTLVAVITAVCALAGIMRGAEVWEK